MNIEIKRVNMKKFVLLFLNLILVLPNLLLSRPEIDTIRAVRVEKHYGAISELQKDINELLENTDFSNALIGISVQSLESGEYFFRLNDNKNFIPASAQKLITTLSALEYLGADFTFTTLIYLDGVVQSNGEFVGNIIIRGGGDPTFSSIFNVNYLEVFDSWAKKIEEKGIKSIRGNIIGDDSYFDKVYYPYGWAWDDMVFPYSAQVSALSVNDNKVDVVVKASEEVGNYAKISISPDIEYVKIENNIKTVPLGGATNIFPLKQLPSNYIELYGTIEQDTIEKEYNLSLAVDNPTMFFLNLFKYSLEKNKIKFKGALLDVESYSKVINYSKLKPLIKHQSAPLSEIISVVNKYSHNLASEMLLKTIAKEISGVGSFENGIFLVKKFLKKAGIIPENLSIVDGSGLSRLNYISPKYFIALLNFAWQSDYKNVFLQSLAQPGKDGTLKKRLRRTLAENNLLAKTGTMSGVSTLVGYIRTRDGEMLSFSMMFLNYSVPDIIVQNLQDLICMRLASFTRKL